MGSSDLCHGPSSTDRWPVFQSSVADLPCCVVWPLYVLRPIPRRAWPSASVLPLGHHWSSPLSGRLDSRITSFEACSGFTRVAARTVANLSCIDFCPWSFDAAVAHDASQVATQAYRQFLGLDFHQLSHNTFARHTPIIGLYVKDGTEPARW